MEIEFYLPKQDGFLISLELIQWEATLTIIYFNYILKLLICLNLWFNLINHLNQVQLLESDNPTKLSLRCYGKMCSCESKRELLKST